MKPHNRVAIVLLWAPLAVSQSAWKHSQHNDPLRRTTSEEFTLEGQYLTAPANAPDGMVPTFVVRCTPDPRAERGHARGRFNEGFVHIGSIVDSGMSSGAPGRVHVQFRRDDGKLQDDYWTHSTDFSSVFLSPYGDQAFNTLLYGHGLPHKEGTGPQTRKLVIGLEEYLGTEVVAQFDFPDSTEVAETCGVIWHK